MKRWHLDLRDDAESPAEVEAFLEEYRALCRRHNMALSHEDCHGGFIVQRGDIDRVLSWSDLAMLIDPKPEEVKRDTVKF